MMKQSEYLKLMEGRSLLIKEAEETRVSVESIKTRIDAIELPDSEYNKAITKKRLLEEYIADLGHKRRMIEAQVDAKLRLNIVEDHQEPD